MIALNVGHVHLEGACWTPDPKLLSYVGAREGRGRDGHNFTTVMEQIRERTSSSVFGLGFFPGTLQPVLEPMYIVSHTATKLHKQFWGIIKNQGCSLIKPLNLPFCHKTP